MPLKLNYQSDGYYHKVFRLNEATVIYEEVKDLITAGGGGGGGGGANLTGYALTSDVLSLLSGYTSSVSFNNLLSSYTDTTKLNIILATKQNNIIAGTGITLVGNTISSSQTISFTIRWGSTISHYNKFHRIYIKSSRQCVEPRKDGVAACNYITIR